MFVTKKHLTRRSVLRGVGTALALPLLDAMIPARTALAQTAANPTPHSCVPRFGGAHRSRRPRPQSASSTVRG